MGWYYEVRGVLQIEKRDYDAGAADLRTAIGINRDDQAATFEAWPKASVSAEALRHGKQQVRQMLKDRPAMGRYGEKADVLSQWAACKFAGEDLGKPIFWSSIDPLSKQSCESYSPGLNDTDPAYIRVQWKYDRGPRKGEERAFEEMWSDAVFELYNVASAKDKDVDRCRHDCAAGRLSEREYVLSLMKIESVAAEKTRSFYLHAFLPWAKEHQVPSNPRLWYLTAREDRSECLLAYMREGDTYWRYYEWQYDKMALDSMVNRGDKDRAIKRANELEQKALTDIQRAQIVLTRARLYTAPNELDAAIADYTKAIRLCPAYALAYYGRGRRYASQFHFKEAIADYTEAIRLDSLSAATFCAVALPMRPSATRRKRLKTIPRLSGLTRHMPRHMMTGARLTQ